MKNVEPYKFGEFGWLYDGNMAIISASHDGNFISDVHVRASYKKEIEMAPILASALEDLLKESSEDTRQRCAEFGESYGNGTEAQQRAREVLESIYGKM